jgi:adhesin transport system outer membrane protein
MRGVAVVMPLAVVALVGCAAQDDQSDVRVAVQERLAATAGAATGDIAGPVNVQAGLAQALREAVGTNAGYLAALANEREALGQVGVAQSALGLQLGGSANVGGIRETGATATTTTGVAGGVNLSQLVYDGGATTAAINRATALALSAQAARLARGDEIALGAARAWIDLWQYAERLRLLRARTTEMDTLLEQLDRMASNGMTDRASLDSARRQVVDIKLEESRLSAGQAEAKVQFERYFRSQPSAPKAPAELVSAAQARSIAGDWRNAPALQRQAADLIAAAAALREAEAAFQPRARVQAGARSPLEQGESTDITVGLMMEYSFSDGGRRLKQREAAEARLQAAEAQLADAERLLEADLQTALARLEAIERAMPLLADKLRLSRSAAQTARSQLQTGQSGLRQLVEAEIDIYRAQDQQASMQAERQALLLTIAARTGALGRLVGLPD